MSKMRVTLGVNVDHVATVRQARGTTEPDPVTGAALAELAGADGITVHLREDRRHIQDRDVEILRQTVQTRLNLEMAATDEMVAIACRILPHMVTLVPEKREELTTEGGLDVLGTGRLAADIARLKDAGILVSLFVDPDESQIRASAEAGADYIEIHTGNYAEASAPAQRTLELERIRRGLEVARTGGLGVNAGHGLNYQNVSPIAALEGIEELNIGHSIIARAVLVGMERAVSEMVQLIREA